MPSRRDFLTTMAAGLTVSALADRWAAAHPRDYRGLLLQARASMLAGQSTVGLERARAALALAPDSLETHEMLGRVYQNQHRWVEAESLWSAAARRFPDETGIGLQVSFCREQRGDLAGAERAVRDVLQREPEDAEALNTLGYLLADHNRELHEAERLIEEARQCGEELRSLFDKAESR